MSFPQKSLNARSEKSPIHDLRKEGVRIGIKKKQSTF